MFARYGVDCFVMLQAQQANSLLFSLQKKVFVILTPTKAVRNRVSLPPLPTPNTIYSMFGIVCPLAPFSFLLLPLSIPIFFQ